MDLEITEEELQAIKLYRNEKYSSINQFLSQDVESDISLIMSGEKIDYSQIINHFEFHNEISNKKNLFINLLRYCEYNRINLFSFYPLTIILYFKKEYL